MSHFPGIINISKVEVVWSRFWRAFAETLVFGWRKCHVLLYFDDLKIFNEHVGVGFAVINLRGWCYCRMGEGYCRISGTGLVKMNGNCPFYSKLWKSQ